MFLRVSTWANCRLSIEGGGLSGRPGALEGQTALRCVRAGRSTWRRTDLFRATGRPPPLCCSPLIVSHCRFLFFVCVPEHLCQQIYCSIMKFSQHLQTTAGKCVFGLVALVWVNVAGFLFKSQFDLLEISVCQRSPLTLKIFCLEERKCVSVQIYMNSSLKVCSHTKCIMESNRCSV